MRSISKDQSINPDLDFDLEDAFLSPSEFKRETIFLNRLFIEDIASRVNEIPRRTQFLFLSSFLVFPLHYVTLSYNARQSDLS